MIGYVVYDIDSGKFLYVRLQKEYFHLCEELAREGRRYNIYQQNAAPFEYGVLGNACNQWAKEVGIQMAHPLTQFVGRDIIQGIFMNDDPHNQRVI